MPNTHFDVLILGAGLSGIGAACHLTRKLKHKTYAILEQRNAIGGTWDLFRYPGIRSDSDMSTFGFNFRPWKEPQVLADGLSIKRYLIDAAEQYGVPPHIRFGRTVTEAKWSSIKALWTVTALNVDDGSHEHYTARYVIAATGYYSYKSGFTPPFPGRDQFKGRVIHPQQWPQAIDIIGKKIVVIGSGATAITLVPSLAAAGAHVTMLQRSPSYVLPVPAIDPVWSAISRILPSGFVYRSTRLRNIGLQRMLFLAARQWPKTVKRLLLLLAARMLRGKVDIKHFTPHYKPWDERLCVIPDGDLFKVLRDGRARIVTDTISTFDATGIQLDSGEHLEADIVVTATGLNLQLFGGAHLEVDGEPMVIKNRLAYKGMMIEDVPNLVAILGYTNASWTLKADIVSEHFMRMIAHMDKHRLVQVTPRARGASHTDETAMGSLASGYVRRGADQLPRQGERAPWRVLNDYVRDAIALKLGRVTHDALEYRSM